MRINIKAFTIVVFAMLCFSFYSYVVINKVRNYSASQNIQNSSAHHLNHGEHNTLKENKSYIKKLEHQRNQYVLAFIILGCTLILSLIYISFYLIRIKQGKGIAESNLNRVREDLLLTLDAVNDGVYDWNIRTNLVTYSKQFWRMLGYEGHEFSPNYESFINQVHPDDIELVETQIENYISKTTSEYAPIFRMKHKAGHWVWIHSRGKISYDLLGNPMRMMGTHTDITSLKYAEQKLLKEKDRAEKASQAKTDFLAHMSHEIRTPLTAISGVSNILKNNIENFKDRDKELIKVLNNSTESLIDLVNDILDISKIENGEIDLETERFSVYEFGKNIEDTFKIKAQEKGIDFTFQMMGELVIETDKVRLRQILINLIGNAVKFTEKGSVTVNITKTNWRDIDCFKFEVEDTGIGIHPNQIEAIFSKFKQGDASVSRKYGGTGLGLSISKQLANLMGGDIFVTSVLEKGSVFTLVIPSKNSNVSVIKNEKTLQFPDSSTLKNHNHKVLLVEDYSGNIAMITYMLESMNYECDVAKNGLEALNHFKKKKYDIILMDVQMPEMDGITATKEIRKIEKNNLSRKIPIVGMTAHASSLDKDKCLNVGMDAYLPKPINNNELEETIRALLA